MTLKDRWTEFFEQAKEELGERASFDILAARADDLLADDEASRVDQAYDMSRDHPPTPPKPVDWR